MFSWKFNSKKERGPSWYTIAIIVALVLIIWGYIMSLYVMSIVVFIFAGVYLLLDNNYPDTMDIIINENGIKIGADFYDYPKLEAFSILYDNGKPLMLRLKLKTRGFKVMNIPFNGEINVADLRAFLSLYIEEDAQGEFTAIEKILNYLKI